jgi:hypothetical protein
LVGPFERLALKSNELASKGGYHLSIERRHCKASRLHTKEPVQIIDFKFLSETTLHLEILLGEQLRASGHTVFNLCYCVKGVSFVSIRFLHIRVLISGRDYYFPLPLREGRDYMKIDIFFDRVGQNLARNVIGILLIIKIKVKGKGKVVPVF